MASASSYVFGSNSAIPGARCSGGQRNRPGGHSDGARGACLCGCPGRAQPAGSAGLPARDADGRWPATDFEGTPTMTPTPVRRILWVIAIVVLLGLLMVGL